MSSAVNFHDDPGSALYWAYMCREAKRARGFIQSQRMALDIEAQRWKRLRRSEATMERLDEWAQKFYRMERETEAFIADCDDLRERALRTEAS